VKFFNRRRQAGADAEGAAFDGRCGGVRAGGAGGNRYTVQQRIRWLSRADVRWGPRFFRPAPVQEPPPLASFVSQLGQAQLMAHNGTAAAAEFQKFLDHRGIVINFPLGALAHLGLARAYALSGDTAKAKTAYQDFFALWKDADPDIPILKEAKAEYAKIQ
jgi:hypothetical protein